MVDKNENICFLKNVNIRVLKHIKSEKLLDSLEVKNLLHEINELVFNQRDTETFRKKIRKMLLTINDTIMSFEYKVDNDKSMSNEEKSQTPNEEKMDKPLIEPPSVQKQSETSSENIHPIPIITIPEFAHTSKTSDFQFSLNSLQLTNENFCTLPSTSSNKEKSKSDENFFMKPSLEKPNNRNTTIDIIPEIPPNKTNSSELQLSLSSVQLTNENFCTLPPLTSRNKSEDFINFSENNKLIEPAISKRKFEILSEEDKLNMRKTLSPRRKIERSLDSSENGYKNFNSKLKHNDEIQILPSTFENLNISERFDLPSDVMKINREGCTTKLNNGSYHSPTSVNDILSSNLVLIDGDLTTEENVNPTPYNNDFNLKNKHNILEKDEQNAICSKLENENKFPSVEDIFESQIDYTLASESERFDPTSSNSHYKENNEKDFIINNSHFGEKKTEERFDSIDKNNAIDLKSKNKNEKSATTYDSLASCETLFQSKNFLEVKSTQNLSDNTNITSDEDVLVVENAYPEKYKHLQVDLEKLLMEGKREFGWRELPSIENEPPLLIKDHLKNWLELQPLLKDFYEREKEEKKKYRE